MTAAGRSRFGIPAVGQGGAVTHVLVGHMAAVAVGHAEKTDAVTECGEPGRRAADREIAIIRMCADTKDVHHARIIPSASAIPAVAG